MPLLILSSRSTFACNRVRTHALIKWVIKEFDNVVVPEQDHGVFYSMEAYVIRWAFVITVVRELEGLTPGQGPFAKDREYQKSLVSIRMKSKSNRCNHSITMDLFHYDVIGEGAKVGTN